MKSMDTSRAEDPEKSALLTMLTAWKSVIKGGATLKDAIDQCNRVRDFNPITKVTTYEHPGLRAAVMACAPKLDVETLGKWIRGNKDRIVNGMCFDKKPGRATIWSVREVKAAEPGPEDIM